MSDYLIDTNVLVRLVLPHDPLNAAASGAVDELKRRDEKVCVAAQNLVEFWSVATRPVEVNGLGMEPDRVASEVDRIEKMFRVLDDRASVYGRWRKLLRAHAVRGRQREILLRRERVKPETLARRKRENLKTAA